MMEEFNSALFNIEKLNIDLASIKSNMNTKLNVINSYNLYTSNQLENLRLSNIGLDNNRYVFARKKDKIVDGQYGIYGQTIHAAFAKMPSNVFNFLTETGPIFKNNAIVEFYDKNDNEELINRDYKVAYSDMLKYESDTTKNDVFKVFEKDTFTMAIQVNIGNLSGGTNFNMIEFCPYLPGSFNIEAIRIWNVDQYYTQDLDVPYKSISTEYDNVGTMRIALDEKIALYRIEFDIKINYQMNGYPFGLRHLYFYDADMNTENDYIVLEVNKDDYIGHVGQDIILMTPYGNINTTADQHGIEYYMFYNNGAFQTPLSNPIARNITKFYAKIPLKEPLIGIEFKDIETR